MGELEEREARTEERITVREVTGIQVSWTEVERAAPGAVTIQLILDRGAEDYVLRPTSADAEVILRLFDTNASAMFDLERKVLIFPSLTLSS